MNFRSRGNRGIKIVADPRNWLFCSHDQIRWCQLIFNIMCSSIGNNPLNGMCCSWEWWRRTSLWLGIIIHYKGEACLMRVVEPYCQYPKVSTARWYRASGLIVRPSCPHWNMEKTIRNDGDKSPWNWQFSSWAHFIMNLLHFCTDGSGLSCTGHLVIRDITYL